MALLSTWSSGCIYVLVVLQVLSRPNLRGTTAGLALPHSLTPAPGCGQASRGAGHGELGDLGVAGAGVGAEQSRGHGVCVLRRHAAAAGIPPPASVAASDGILHPHGQGLRYGL